MTDTAYRPDIDGLRGIAVLGVLLFHLGVPGISGGFAGVDVFFVISGYLITRQILADLERSRFTYRGFYARRVRRLAPALLFTVGGTLAGAFILSAPQELALTGKTALFSLLSVSNIFFWTHSGYFDNAAHGNPLLHTWSLGIEERFYLLWPVALVLLARRTSTTVRMTALVALTITSFLACEYMLEIDDSAAFYLLPFRAWELGVGALLAVSGTRIRSTSAQEATSLAGLVAIVASFTTLTSDSRFPGLSAAAACLGTALVIQANGGALAGAVLRNPAMVKLGLVSYSLYLVHWPLIVLLRQQKVAEFGTLEKSVLAVASLGVAVLLYRFVEQPFRYRPVGRPGPLFQTRLCTVGAPAALVVLGVLVAVPAAIAWSSGGQKANDHVDDGIQQLLSARTFAPAPGGVPDSAALRIAVVGDSHANRLSYGLWQLGRERDIDVQTFNLGGGCPPLIGISAHGISKQFARCERVRDRTLESIALQRFDVVVLAARWGLYSVQTLDGSRTRFLSESGQPRHSDIERSRRVLESGLRATVSAMQDAGASVVFFGQIPPLPSDPFPCIARLANAGAASECFSVDRPLAESETGWALELAQRLAREIGFLVIDPVPLMCRPRCVGVLDDQALYTDSNHLSNAGSMALARPVLDQILSLELARKRLGYRAGTAGCEPTQMGFGCNHADPPSNGRNSVGSE